MPFGILISRNGMTYVDFVAMTSNLERCRLVIEVSALAALLCSQQSPLSLTQTPESNIGCEMKTPYAIAAGAADILLLMK